MRRRIFYWPGLVGTVGNAGIENLISTIIAELERRLAGLTPADSNSTSNLPSIGGSQYSSPAGISHRQASGSSAAANITVDSFGSSHIHQPDIQQIWVQDNNKSTTVSNDMNNDWDLGGLFMVPANWPKQLPSACEYAAERLFTRADQSQSYSNTCRLLRYP